MTSFHLRKKMRLFSDYSYWKLHFDCLKASNVRSEKPMGVHLTPFDVRGLTQLMQDTKERFHFLIYL